MLLNSATITIKTDPETKSAAQKLAEQLGISLSSVLNSLMKEFVRTKKLEVGLKEDELELSDYAKQALAESEEDVKAGRVYSFGDTKDAVQFLRDRSEKIEKNGYES